VKENSRRVKREKERGRLTAGKIISFLISIFSE